jgi:glutamate racemase
VLVLGCTHYPLLRQAIAEVAGELARRPVALVDSASTLAGEVRALRNADVPAGAITAPWSFCVTDPSRFAEVGTRFLGEPIPDVEVVDID